MWLPRSPVSRRRAARLPEHPAASRAAGGAGAPLCVEQLRRVHRPSRAGQPLLLILEDLHWADESTLLLTEYLAPLLPRCRCWCSAPTGTSKWISASLARVIGQLGRRRLVERVNLRRLSFDGVRAMLQALAGQPAPEQLVR